MRFVPLFGLVLLFGCPSATTDPTDAGEDAGVRDLGVPDLGQADDAGTVDAGSRLDAGPVEAGSAITCDDGAQIDKAGEYTTRPLLRATSSGVVLFYQRGLNPPLKISTQIYDGAAWTEPTDIIDTNHTGLRPHEPFVTPAGKIGLISQDQTGAIRRVVSADLATFGAIDRFPTAGVNCVGNLAAAGETLLHAPSVGTDLTLSSAAGVDFVAGAPLGFAPIDALNCPLALTAAGDGAAIATGRTTAIRARALRAGVPTGDVVTATITGGRQAFPGDLKAAASPNGDVVVIGYYDDGLFTLAYFWNGQRLLATAPEMIEPAGSTSSAIAIDSEGRATVVWIGNAHTYVRRRIGRIWRARQDLGPAGAFGWDPTVVVAPNGDVAVLSTGPSSELVLHWGGATDETLADEVIVRDAAIQEPTAAFLPSGELMVAWPENVETNREIFGARCRRR